MGMKKIYLSPYVETTKMRFNYVICGTTNDNEQMQHPGDVAPPMPGRLF